MEASYDSRPLYGVDAGAASYFGALASDGVSFADGLFFSGGLRSAGSTVIVIVLDLTSAWLSSPVPAVPGRL